MPNGPRSGHRRAARDPGRPLRARRSGREWLRPGWLRPEWLRPGVAPAGAAAARSAVARGEREVTEGGTRREGGFPGAGGAAWGFALQRDGAWADTRAPVVRAR
ncbi:hypothetical protein GCM10023324_19470 [Streptomyces youssoufiensis]